MKKITIALIVLFSMIIIPVWPANAVPTPINLNDFSFFPGDPVTIAIDGSTATIAEDPIFSPIPLLNDPGLFDPEVIFAEIGGVPQILSFDFDFDEPAGNEDEFGAFVLDSSGISAGPAFEFFASSSSSGTVSFDLSGLTSEPFIGLQFQLAALFSDSGLDSTVTVSNVRLAPVPEPATMILVGTGLFGLLGLGRKKFRNKG